MTDKNIEFLFNQGRDLLKLAEKANVDETQIVLTKSLEIGTRFGENHITQNSFSDTTNLALTLVKDRKIVKLNLNLPKPNDYENIINDALTILKLSEPDNDFPGFIEESSNNINFQHTNKVHIIEDVTENIKNIISSALSYDSSIKTVAGNINTFNNYNIFLNSHGVELWENLSRASSVINISALKSGNDYESRSTIKISGNSIKSLDVERHTKICAERAKRGLSQTNIDIGTYKTILSPSAVSELLRFIAFGTSAESLINHSSFLKDKLGEQVFDTALTISDERDNPSHYFSSSFDSDGTSVNTIKFIDKGILKDFAYNRRLSKKLIDDKSNGRNLDGFGGEMPLFATKTVLPGNKSEEELIKSIDSGIYVVNLFYNNFVNPPEGLCTGLTRDGLFKIEHGEIVGSLKNMRWTDKIESIFRSIEVANNPVQIGGFFFGSDITPSIKTDQFTLTSAGKH
jgi:PmbA protein